MTEEERTLVALAGIFVLGVGSQWVASRVRLPSILLLLITGILVGPVLGLLHPEQLFGDLLAPLVSLSVAIVLFEGGLSLRLRDLKAIGRPLTMLLSAGLLLTWCLCSLAAWGILQFSFSLALLLGAILTVTGPTVIGPLLRHIRPVGQVGPIARWEGIVVDPIGAVLAVLVFAALEAVRAANFDGAVWIAAIGFLKTMCVGALLGGLAAGMFVELMRRHLITDHLQSPFALMLVVAAFAASNLLMHESGLVTVTVMGVLLANQQAASVRHIIEFKENLSVLLISGLFILLTARLQLEQFQVLSWRGPMFVAFVIVVVRPVSVMVSTIGTGLTMSERLFLSWFAPRGIVAAAVASLFALTLEKGQDLVAATFLVVFGTVVTYGLTARFVAVRLGLSNPDAQGVLFGSAHPGVRAIAAALQEAGVSVCLVDRNAENLRVARMEGVPTFHADILSEALHDNLDVGEFGRFLAMTPNDEVNGLAAGRFQEVFGKREVYRLAAVAEGDKPLEKSSEVLDGRVLFAEHATYEYLDRRFENGARVKATPLTDEFGIEEFSRHYSKDALVMFILEPPGQVTVVTTDLETTFKSGQTLIALVDLPRDADS